MNALLIVCSLGWVPILLWIVLRLRWWRAEALWQRRRANQWRGVARGRVERLRGDAGRVQ